jgi:hypothetical protein
MKSKRNDYKKIALSIANLSHFAVSVHSLIIKDSKSLLLFFISTRI